MFLSLLEICAKRGGKGHMKEREIVRIDNTHMEF
jgi:hypothetical protein